MNTLTKVLFLPILALLDIITTHIGFSVGLGEANPLMDGVIQHWWGMLLKMAITLAIAVAFYFILKRYQQSANAYARWVHRTTNIFLLIATLLMASAPIWNTVQISIMLGWLN